MIYEAIARAVTGANLAHGLMEAALVEFHTYVEAKDWARAESARQRVVGHMESYLDGMVVIHRMMPR